VKLFERWKCWASAYSEDAEYGTGMSFDKAPHHMFKAMTGGREERSGLERIPNSMRSVEPDVWFKLKRLYAARIAATPSSNP